MDIKRLYRKFLGERFFNKIVAIYTIITIFVLLLLSYIVSQNILSSAKNNSINYSQKVMVELNEYFKLKVFNVKLFQSLPYLMKNPYSTVLDFLDSDTTQHSDNYVSQRQLVDQYLHYTSLLDSSISDIFLVKLNDHSIYYNDSKQATSSIESVDYSSLESNKFFGAKNIEISFIPKADNEKSYSDTFCIGTNFRNKDFTEVNGILLVNFDTQNISDAYSKDLDCNVIVINDSNNVIFDSSGKSNGAEYPEAVDIKKDKTGLLVSREGITSHMVNDQLGITIICKISSSQIYMNTKTIIQVIIIITLICILISVLLSYSSMFQFYKKIKDVCSAMDSVKSGDLGNRLKISGNMDEINMIASNFNTMCDHLQDYIHEVFELGIKRKEAELKQRTAELYALQSQINPHFLYNTLEAIHMKAIGSGSSDVAKMVRILGSLFRYSIRSEMIIDIAEEINFCELYFDLLSLRYNEKFRHYSNINPAILGYSIIKHTFQPIIENAMVHGFDSDKEYNDIFIYASIEDMIITFQIRDNGVGISQEDLEAIRNRLEAENSADNERIGLVNVNNRIKMIYGNQYGLSIESIKGSFTAITMRIPAKKADEFKEYV